MYEDKELFVQELYENKDLPDCLVIIINSYMIDTLDDYKFYIYDVYEKIYSHDDLIHLAIKYSTNPEHLGTYDYEDSDDIILHHRWDRGPDDFDLFDPLKLSFNVYYGLLETHREKYDTQLLPGLEKKWKTLDNVLQLYIKVLYEEVSTYEDNEPEPWMVDWEPIGYNYRSQHFRWKLNPNVYLYRVRSMSYL